jgi:AraC family transcriptional regulator of adaptative response / DNA-3-methyladenine glycosylase II
LRWWRGRGACSTAAPTAAAINAHLARDAALKPLVRKRPGLRLPSAFDPFELAVRAIVGQQVSVAAATTVTGRVAARCGTPLAGPRAGLTHLFPAPTALASANLDGLGLTTRRADTLRGFAQAVDGRRPAARHPARARRVRRAHDGAAGHRAWTAQYVALRAFGEPDAFPTGDLGLERALPGVDLAQRSLDWCPWRGYAALHLWAGPGD